MATESPTTRAAWRCCRHVRSSWAKMLIPHAYEGDWSFWTRQGVFNTRYLEYCGRSVKGSSNHGSFLGDINRTITWNNDMFPVPCACVVLCLTQDPSRLKFGVLSYLVPDTCGIYVQRIYQVYIYLVPATYEVQDTNLSG